MALSSKNVDILLEKEGKKKRSKRIKGRSTALEKLSFAEERLKIQENNR